MALIVLEISVALFLILLNGFFSMAEMALVSVRRARLGQKAEAGDRRAQRVLEITSQQTKFLSTVQVAITLVGVLNAAFGGSTIANQIEGVIIATWPQLTPWSEAVNYAALGIFVIVLTFLTIVFGELVPKRIGIAHAENIALNVAGVMTFTARLVSPVARILGFTTDLTLKALRVPTHSEAPITEEEIKNVLEEGTQAGVIEEAEQDMVENVFRLGDRSVSTIMTPRPDIVWIDLAETSAHNWAEIAQSDHSHFPVCDGDIDNVIGTVSVKTIWNRLVNNQPIDLRQIIQPPLFVPGSAQVLTLLELFKHHRRHTALVTDEFGSVQGLVNQIDVLEAVVGFIPTLDENEDRIVRRADGSWLLDGMVGIEEFKKRFEMEKLPGEERGDFTTLGGFLLMQLGRIPKAADTIHFDGWKFEVVDMDGRRVDKILVVPPKSPVIHPQTGAQAAAARNAKTPPPH